MLNTTITIIFHFKKYKLSFIQQTFILFCARHRIYDSHSGKNNLECQTIWKFTPVICD